MSGLTPTSIRIYIVVDAGGKEAEEADKAYRRIASDLLRAYVTAVQLPPAFRLFKELTDAGTPPPPSGLTSLLERLCARGMGPQAQVHRSSRSASPYMYLSLGVISRYLALYLCIYVYIYTVRGEWDHRRRCAELVDRYLYLSIYLSR